MAGRIDAGWFDMISLLSAVLRSVIAGFRARRNLVLENLALRHQLLVLNRKVKSPTRRNPRSSFWTPRATLPAPPSDPSEHRIRCMLAHRSYDPVYGKLRRTEAWTTVHSGNPAKCLIVAAGWRFCHPSPCLNILDTTPKSKPSLSGDDE
jgi:hypothetical protein